MKTFIETTRLVGNEQQLDINYLNLQRFKNPLVVCTRSGQMSRIDKWYKTTPYTEIKDNFDPTIIGWWELKDAGYLDKNFYLDVKKWRQHDAVFFLDPQRAYNPEAFLKLIRTVTETV